MKDVYKGDSKSLAEFLQTQELYFIPEYQRMYEWGEDNIEQLFDDVTRGIHSLDKAFPQRDRELKFSKFLGCVITWTRDFRKTDGADSCDISKQNKVNEVIDGQQRLSTFLIICTRFYANISVLKALLDSSTEEESRILSQLDDYAKRLLSIFTRRSNVTTRCYFPALIRQSDDRWDCNCSQPNLYTSPISKYLNLFFVNIKSGNTDLSSVKSDDVSLNKIIEKIDDLIAMHCTSNNFTGLEEKLDDIEVFTDELNPLGASEIVVFGNRKLSEVAQQSVVCMSFLHYFLNYCAVTVISSPHESKALDMFQSLNSTGMQLNALQIFKPHLSRSYTVETPFSAHSEFKLYNNIEEWIDRNKRQKETRLKTFFIRLGQVFSGADVRASLSSQKKWIVEEFNNYSTQPSLFIEIMYYSKEYLSQFVVKTRADLVKHDCSNLKLIHSDSNLTTALSEEAKLCLLFITDVNHDLAHSVLMLFYLKFRLSATEFNAEKSKTEFEKVLKAVTAYFFLWRTTIRTYPDASYSHLLKNYFSLSALPNRDVNTLEANYVIKKLRAKLRWEIRKKTRRKGYIAKPKIAYGSTKHDLIRLALLIYSHKSKPMVDVDLGLTESNMAGHDFLNARSWLDDGLMSVEHIAPQKAEVTGDLELWQSTFINDSASINSVGNLTLLSQPVNSSIGEDTASKRDYYGSMNTTLMFDGVTTRGNALVKSAGSVSHLLPIYYRLDAWLNDVHKNSVCPELSQYSWSSDFIFRREENILERLETLLFDDWLCV